MRTVVSVAPDWKRVKVYQSSMLFNIANDLLFYHDAMTVKPLYNMIIVTKIPTKTPIARPQGDVWSVFCEFSLIYIVHYSLSCYHVMIYFVIRRFHHIFYCVTTSVCWIIVNFVSFQVSCWIYPLQWHHKNTPFLHQPIHIKVGLMVTKGKYWKHCLHVVSQLLVRYDLFLWEKQSE